MPRVDSTKPTSGPRGTRAPRKPLPEQRKVPLRSNLRGAIADDELRRQIAETAYYKAEQRGFSPGYEERDWLEAEAEVMQRLGEQRQPRGTD
jgi:hypothetical protein